MKKIEGSLAERGYVGLHKTTCIFLALAFAALMTIAAIWDLDININLGSASNAFGQYFAKIGEFPAYLAIPLGFALLYRGINENVKRAKLLKAITVILLFVANYACFSWLKSRFVDPALDYTTLYIISFALFFTVFDCFLVRAIDDKTARKLVVWAVFVLAVLALSQLIVTVAKSVWARQRFRTMLNGNYSGFTAWYLPQGFTERTAEHVAAANEIDTALGFHGDAFKSFPSGHTAGAAVSFTVILLPDIFKKLSKYRVYFYIAPFLLTLAVGLSRIVNMAHYLSDITCGGYITFVVAVLLRRLFWRFYDFDALDRVQDFGEVAE